MAKKKGTGFIAEFKQFIMRGNVIDLAVGVIIGAAFQAIVNSLVKDIITPCIGALFGDMDFSELAVTLRPAVTETVDGVETVVTEAVLLKYGSFITAIINFLLMAIVIFIIIKVINSVSSKLHKEAEIEEIAAAPTTKTCPFCKTDIAIEATRCPHCTSQLEE